MDLPELRAAPLDKTDYSLPDGTPLLLRQATSGALSDSDRIYMHLVLTDGIRGWIEVLEGDDIIMDKLKKLNPRIAANVSALMSQAIELVQAAQPGQVTFLSESTDLDMLNIRFSARLSRGVPFVYEVNARLLTPQEFFNLVSRSVYLLSLDSQRRIRDLMDILDAKDRELDAYKARGATLARKSIATTKFDKILWLKEQDTKFSASSSTSENITTSFAEPRFVTAYVACSKAIINSEVEHDGDNEPNVPDHVSPSTTPQKSPSRNRSPAKSPAGKAPTSSDSKKPENVEVLKRKTELKRMMLQEQKDKLAKKKKGPRF